MRGRRVELSAAVAAIAAIALAIGCKGDAGAAGTSCTVVQDSTTDMVTITCEDGTSATVPPGSTCTVVEDPDAGTTTVTCDGSSGTITNGTNGTEGTNGTSCTVAEDADGTKTITCDDGTSVVVSDGRDLTTRGTLLVAMEASSPASGGFFAAGERIVVTMTLRDTSSNPLTLDDLSTAGLYMYGPNDVRTVETAAALLGASTDRSVSPHHYIDLKTTTSANLVVTGNVLQYTLEAITDEPAGTYVVGFRATSAQNSLDQVFALIDVQIGTTTVQAEIVGNCGDCHEGSNGTMYMHHIDPTSRGSGSPGIDGEPVRTCRTCHNNEGYAAYQRCSDGTRPPCTAPATLERVPDTIVRRVHGVHNGNNLTTPFNIDPDNGDFADYTHTIFPADVRNCTKCHLDDSWQSRPSRLACGSCHDAVNFVDGSINPPRLGAACGSGGSCATGYTCNTTTNVCERGTHGGGAEADDTGCSTCHDSAAIADVHDVPAPAFSYNVALSMSAAAGTHYVDESPTITIAVTNLATGAAVDPATITDTAFGRVNLYVSGPRASARPVLTTAAEGVAQIRAQVASGAAPFDLSSATSLSLSVDGTAITVPVSSGTFASLAAATGPEVVAWLNGDTAFAALATASSSTSRGVTKVTIKSNARGSSSSIEVTASAGASALGLAPGVYAPIETHSYANNDLRIRTDPFDADPRITRTATEIIYQLDSVAGLTPGTYSIWVEVGAAPPMSSAQLNFQVGTATAEPRVATNCVSCHEGTRMHASYFAISFDPDICRSCHDYERQIEGGVGWAGAGPNMGFGAAPLARRVHGVHRGHYLDRPEEVHASYDYSGVIFPQDIRNCTTCHSESNSWAENPSRVACLACHDSDAAIGHGALMTVDPTPADPYSGDEIETCVTCHGPGRERATDVVHDVMTVYRPPYPR